MTKVHRKNQKQTCGISSSKSTTKTKNKALTIVEEIPSDENNTVDDDTNSGFASYLRSGEGKKDTSLYKLKFI